MSSRKMDMSDMGRAAEETELQRAANQHLIEEGRIIRHKELERQRKEEESYQKNGSSDTNLRIGSSGSTSRYNNQRSFVDLGLDGGSVKAKDVRELRNQLNQFQEKLKGAMMVNVQLDNDKQLLNYEVELLKDKLEDMTDGFASLNKTYLENKRELAYHRMQIVELTHRLDYARHQVEARDQLLIEHDFVLLGGTDADSAPSLTKDELSYLSEAVKTKQISNGVVGSDSSNPEFISNGVSTTKLPEMVIISKQTNEMLNTLSEMVIISKQTNELLNTLSEKVLDKKIQKLFEIRSDLLVRIEELESQLRDERKRSENPSPDTKNLANGFYSNDVKRELQQSRLQTQEYKHKFQDSQQRISSLESEINRLESQTKRYKNIADSCEQQEEILKQDKRKYQRELREVTTQMEDLKSENTRLQRMVDKLGRGSVTSLGLPLRHGRESSVNR